MSKRILSSLAIVLTTFSVPHMAPMAFAQTSFGTDRIVAPTNRKEWEEVVGNQLMNGIRNANTSLGMHAGVGGISAVMNFSIARNGEIVDVQILESTGKAPIDQALLRASSRIQQVAPFTPDMTADGVSYTFALGSERR